MMVLDGLYLVRDRLSAYFNSTGYAGVGAWLLGIWIVSILTSKSPPRLEGAPIHGYRSKWEPALILQFRFVLGAFNIISSGYKKFKDTPFVLRRYDTDITILPIKYLEELRITSRDKFNALYPHTKNLVPRWTWTQFMLESNMNVRVLNSKLNPELNKFVELSQRELDYGWNIEIPQLDKWTEVNVQHIMRKLVSRMSAKVFVGNPACRDPEWLKVSIDFTEDLFVASSMLRMFPPILHPIVAHFIPARRRVRREIDVGKKVVHEFKQMRKQAQDSGFEPEETLLAWMIDNGTAKENDIEEMAARQCMLTFAGIHTTSHGVSNVLFDLVTHSEWLPAIREEIEQTTATYGRIGESSSLTSKQWLGKLEKLDSFIVESQRVNPGLLLRPQRVALAPLTLKDGTYIAKGTHVAWAGHHHANDPITLGGDPDTFDPLRNYHKRYANDGENMSKFIAGQTDINSLSFGYGSQACPGRYFAVSEIKLILARLLVEYDFCYPPGKSRPKNSFADENGFMEHVNLMMKKRTAA